MPAPLDVQHYTRLERVNRATTEAEHRLREAELRAWRDGVADAFGMDDADRGRIIMRADMMYLDQPEHAERPMCGGVWLDWVPAEVPREG